MRCNQCGKEILDNSVFCPFCGVPQKVTADYDYIQSEIGANVDKIKNTGDTTEIPYEKRKNIQHSPSGKYEDEDLMKTRNIYGKDTIYDEKPGKYMNSPKDYDDRGGYDDGYDEYDGGYDDGYDDHDDNYDRRSDRKKNRHDDDDYFYNSFDDLDDYEKEKGGNKGIIVTTVIIVIICLLGIAAIIYFGLKPQDKTNEETQPGITTEAADTAQTETAADTTTEPDTETESYAIASAEAEDVVYNYLVENDIMYDDYSTPDGGFINLAASGTAKINNGTYYIIQTDYYDSSNNLWETSYYGVDVSSGDLYKIKKDGSSYTIV